MSHNEKHSHETIQVNGIDFTHGDLFRVVDAFYRRVQTDPILQVPFRSVHDWPEHVENLTHFWWMRFGGKPYRFNQYNPVAKHYFAGFSRELLTRWLSIFRETLEEHLTTEQATFWKLLTERMGESLLMRNEMYGREYETRNPRGNGEKP